MSLGSPTVFRHARSCSCSRRSHLYHLLQADAGLRPGEGCAVVWTDYDPVVRTLRIERTVTDTGRIKETKTGDSREVDLSPRLAAALNDLRAELEVEALAARRDDISPWILSTRAGKPPRPHRVAKAFRRVLWPPVSPSSACTTCGIPTRVI